ncbi:MAG: hypothetical protein R3A48_07855 [Polyangiales bacterium]
MTDAGSANQMKSDEPFENLEAVLASVAHVLVAKGYLEEASVFAKSAVDLEYVEHDNWNGVTSVWSLNIRVPLPQFTSYSDGEKKAIEELISDAIKPFIMTNNHWVNPRIQPMPFKDPDWRRNVAIAVSGSDATNQGRAHSAHVAPLEFDGLLFRSQPEIAVYKALKATGIPFAPLPVFVRGGPAFSRVEPDFVLIKDGVVVFLEIDGASFHRESPADAHYRTKPFQDEGVVVERVKAADCNTPEKAALLAKQLGDLIRKRAGQK